MSNYNITNETLAMAKLALSQGMALEKSAVTTTGYGVGLGITGFSLEAPAKSLVPVNTQLRNRTPRTKAKQGSEFATWRAILDFNANKVRGSYGFGYAAPVLATTAQSFQAKYKKVGLGNTTPLDANILARGFDDLRARMSMNTLNQTMIEEEIIMLGGQAFSLGTPTTPILTAGTSGTIGTANVAVRVTARTLAGYHTNYQYIDADNNTVSTPNSTLPSAAANNNFTSGTTNSLTAKTTAIPGAVVYDWYVGLNAGTLYYYTSTTVNSVTITSVPTQAAPVPTLLSNMGTPNPNPPSVDGSGNENSFDGLIATISGDYSVAGSFVTRGTGTPTGSYVKSLEGANLTATQGTINEFDEALFYIYATAQLSPNRIVMSAKDLVNISNKIIQSGGAYTVFNPTNLSERQSVAGGQLVSEYLNKHTNTWIKLESNVWMVPGTIIFETNQLPYPTNDVANVLEIETQVEYMEHEYPASRKSGSSGGLRYDIEVFAIEVLKNYFPKSMAILHCVGNG